MESYKAIGLARRSEFSGVVYDCLRRRTGPDCFLYDKIRRHYQRVVYEKRMASIEAMVKAKVRHHLVPPQNQPLTSSIHAGRATFL
jgi:hypothetical protein